MANFAHEVDPGLEEFLVKLTVQGPDSGQLRDAEAGLESLRLGIAALLPGLTAAAAGTVAVIKTFADSLTETFYAAQKLGSTTEHVTALGDAAERAGDSVEGIRDQNRSSALAVWFGSPVSLFAAAMRAVTAKALLA
jgi:hypothetical protein